MSIPSIRFAQARNRKPQTPIVTKFTISSSSYSYTDDDDDIPMLDSLNQQSNRQAYLSSASLDSDEDYTVKEKDWTAKTKNPQINNRQSPQKNNSKDPQLQRKIQTDEFSSQGSDNEFVFQCNNDTNNIVSSHSSNSKTSVENPKSEISSNQEKVVNQPQQSTSPTNSVINSETTPEITPKSSNDINESEQMHSDKLSSFFVFKQSSSFSKSKKNKYRMEENSKAIFFASESKDSKGKFFAISPSNINQTSETINIVRINSSHEVFTIESSEEKFNDDREGELCGIELCGELVQQSTKNKYKKIKIVLPKNGKPYYPISLRKSLGKIVQIRTKSRDKNMIAFKNSQNDDDDDCTPTVDDPTLKLERFSFYESTTPTNDSDEKKSEEMAKFLINPSPKNFYICDKKGKTIFIFYKIASGSFNASFCHPITPIIAFGISIAVLSSSK